MSAFRSMHELGDLIELLKPHCDPSEHKEFVKNVGAVYGAISTNILSKMFASYPELEKEVDEKIDKYGKFL